MSDRTLSNAAFISSMVTAGFFFLFKSSFVFIISPAMLSRVDLFFRKPDRVGGRTCFCSSHGWILWMTSFSAILQMVDVRAIGLRACLFGFGINFILLSVHFLGYVYDL